MKKVKIILGSMAIFAALTFSACDNSMNGNSAGSDDAGDTFKEGQGGDTGNHMNNGGNYSPDERHDERGGTRPEDSTYKNTGSKFDAQGNSVTGNDAVHSNRQQGATTGEQSNTEQRKQGE